MTVWELSETTLHLRYQPRWLWWTGLGMTLLSIGLLAWWGNVTSLKCTWLTVGVVSCDLSSGWLGFFPTIQTFELWGARVEGGNIVLITPNGRRPVSSVRGLSYSQQRQITVTINSQVGDIRQSVFEVSFVARWQYGVILGLLILGVGGWLGVEGLVIKGDKNAGTLLIQRRRWGWWSAQQHALPQITTVSLSTRGIRAKLWLSLSNGQTVPLLAIVGGQKKCRHFAQTLSTFLTKP